MRRPPDLQLPRPPRWPPWAIATSVVLHLAALVALILLFVPAQRLREGHLLVSLSPQQHSQPRQVLAEPPPSTDRASLPEAAPPLPTPTPSRAMDNRFFVAPTPLGGIPSDSAPSWMAPDEELAFPWPSLGTGLLWDRRAPTEPGVGRTHAQMTDSAVKAIINHYLDSLAALPGGGRLLLPWWKATIGGQEFGLDGQWLTVAGVKIPSLILALIPFPNGGNESKALDVGGRMRAQDYQLALPRAAAAADQREEVKAIRERNAAEQELNRKQREPPSAP